MGKRLAGLSTQQMNLNADMGSRMTERFNVAGALLVWLFGNRSRRTASTRAGGQGPRRRHQDRHEPHRVHGGARPRRRAATAMVYGFGGVMAVNGTLTVGTLASSPLLGRLYAPLTAISNVRVDVMTAGAVRAGFEVLDLQPL